VAQLYGLAGLRLVAPERFAALAPSYRSQAASVRTFRACSGGERAFSDVLGPASSKATVWDISFRRGLTPACSGLASLADDARL
jgi:hypothetical protein